VKNIDFFIQQNPGWNKRYKCYISRSFFKTSPTLRWWRSL